MFIAPYFIYNVLYMQNKSMFKFSAHILVGVVFDLLNRIYRLKKPEETFCVRDRYTKSATATSFIQCNQIIKTVVLSEKLTNIEHLNHVAPVE